MSRLSDLQQRRAYTCRLTPDRALTNLDEAEAFARERGMLTRTADSALPSLFEACHERPYAPGKGGFGEWPATKWPWFGELAGRPGFQVLKVHNGKSLLVAEEALPLFDPICRAEIERMSAADPQSARVLDHLAEAGPSELGDLQVELDLKPKELKLLVSPLERCGAVVRRPVIHETAGGGHVHTSELARWDHVFANPARGSGDLDDVIVAGVRAAVVAPERELPRWFSWRWRFRLGLVDELVGDGLLERVDQEWVTAREPA